MALLPRRRGAGGAAGPPSAKAVDAPRPAPLRGEEDEELGPRPNPLPGPVWSPSTRSSVLAAEDGLTLLAAPGQEFVLCLMVRAVQNCKLTKRPVSFVLVPVEQWLEGRFRS